MAGVSASGWKIADTTWIRMQTKTFTKWVNIHLGKVGTSIESLEEDFKDGLRLVTLAEVLSDEKVKTKVMKKPKLRIMKVQNVGIALEHFRERIPLDIGSEDIVDGNLKLILGMVWTIIQKFDISDISEDELNAKDALLLWCQKKTKKYDNVDITNFHRSWKDGLAFCAIIHAHKPGLIPYDTLSKANDAENLELAFSVAEEQLGIPRFLDVEDMVESEKPDERSVMTYVSQYYRYFASQNKGDTAARRINKLIDATRQLEQMKDDYSNRAAALVEWIKAKTDHLENNMTTDGTIEDTLAKLDELNEYKANEKPPKSAEKLDLEALKQSLALKLSQAGRSPWTAPEGCSTEEIQELWDALEAAESLRLKSLQDENTRLRKLKNLLARFNRKADALEAWHGEKTSYLENREDIDSLQAARSGLKIYDAYEDEYGNAAPRLATVQELGAEIVALEYAEADAVQARVDALTATHDDALKAAAKEKSDYLWECVEREEKKDALRQEFAEKAKAFAKWSKDKATEIAGTTFGNDLESVRACEATLDESDAAITGDKTAKLEELHALDDEMKELGVTKNNYTAITIEDCDNTGNYVDGKIADRRAAYAEEVARQEAMEAKRIEFADAATAFVAQKDEERAAIDAFEGEPEAVEASIQETHQEGAPLQEGLDNCTKIGKEALAMRIHNNPHTDLTVAKLKSMFAQHKIHVKNYLYELKEETSLKAKYTSRAEELVAWINETTPKMEDLSGIDGTLDGVRAAVEEFNQYRINEKGSKAAIKVEIEALANRLTTILSNSEFNRPPFAPPEEYSLAVIQETWNTLQTAESAKDEALQTELTRQEKLVGLLRRFEGDSAELLAWISRSEEYLAKEETVDSVTSAQIQLVVLDSFKNDHSKKTIARDELSALVQDIRDQAYEKQDEVDTKLEEITTRFAALEEAAAEKEGTINAALEAEQAKEVARVAFAKAASDYIRWARDMADTLAEYEFGLTLEEVESYAATLDEDDAKVNENEQRLHAEVNSTNAELEALEAVATTNVSMDDIANEEQTIQTALANRRAAYEAELERQNEMEAKCVEYADAANAFVALIAEKSEAIAAVEGETDERIEAITAIFEDGADASEEYAKCEALDVEASSMGANTSKHTENSVQILKNKLDLYLSLGTTAIESCNEEKELAARAAAAAAESAEQERIETVRIDYISKAQALNVWLDTLQEGIAEELEGLTSSEQVQEQQALFDAATADLDKSTADFETLKADAEQLASAGADFGGFDVGTITEKWERIVNGIEPRGEALAEAAATQAAHDDLRATFNEAGEAVAAWLQDKQGQLNADPSGELAEQLAAAKAILEECNSDGRELLAAFEGAADEISSNNVLIESQYSYELQQTEFNQVIDNAAKKATDIQNEISAAENSKVTPEQLAEFSEIFNHFDKGNTGALTLSQFKAAMQSLGDEPSDEEASQLMGGQETIDLSAFTEIMVNKTEDHDTEDEIVESFALLCDGAPGIPADTLTTNFGEDEANYLMANMPQLEDGTYDYRAWAAAVYSA